MGAYPAHWGIQQKPQLYLSPAELRASVERLSHRPFPGVSPHRPSTAPAPAGTRKLEPKSLYPWMEAKGRVMSNEQLDEMVGRLYVIKEKPQPAEWKPVKMTFKFNPASGRHEEVLEEVPIKSSEEITQVWRACCAAACGTRVRERVPTGAPRCRGSWSG